MDWINFISGITGGFVGGGLGGVLLKLYLDHKLSIQRSELEAERTLKQKQRDASEAVIDILSKWVETTYTGEEFTDKKKWEMQTTYWKNILLLDKDLIDSLLPLLANSKGKPSTNEMVVKVRQKLLNLKEPDIKASDLNNWLP